MKALLLGASILMLLELIICRLRQKPIIESSTGLFLGHVDEVLGPDKRVVSRYSTNTINLQNDQYGHVDLGLSDWGAIQTSLIMKEFPKDYGKKASESFCTVSDQLIGYNLRSSINLDVGDHIYDHLIVNDSIYFMTSQFHVYRIKITPVFQKSVEKSSHGKNSSSSKLEVVWKLDLESDLKTWFGAGKITSAGMALHPDTGILYIVFDAAELVMINVETKQVSKSDQKFNFDEGSMLVYVAIRNNHLFIGFRRKGVTVYDVSNSSDIKVVKEYGPKEFTSNDFELMGFDVDDYQLQIINQNTPEAKALLSTEPDSAAFFRTEYTRLMLNELIEAADFNSKNYFILLKDGVYRIDSDLKSAPVLAFPNSSPGEFYSQIVRFNTMLYLMKSFGSTYSVTELFISQNGTLELNKVWQFNDRILRIYVDENNLYVISEHENFMYPRGIGKEWVNQGLNSGKPFSYGKIHAVSKAIINGIHYLICVGDDSVGEYDILVSDPHLRCPPSNGKEFDTVGTYKFEINSTVRTCPKKIQDKQVLGQEYFMKTPCVFQTSFEIVVVESPFYKQEHHLLKIVVGILLCGLSLCLCVFCLRRRLYHLSSEHEMLRKEIMLYKEKQLSYDTAKMNQNQKYKLNKSSDSFTMDNPKDSKKVGYQAPAQQEDEHHDEEHNTGDSKIEAV